MLFEHKNEDCDFCFFRGTLIPTVPINLTFAVCPKCHRIDRRINKEIIGTVEYLFEDVNNLVNTTQMDNQDTVYFSKNRHWMFNRFILVACASLTDTYPQGIWAHLSQFIYFRPVTNKLDAESLILEDTLPSVHERQYFHYFKTLLKLWDKRYHGFNIRGRKPSHIASTDLSYFQRETTKQEIYQCISELLMLYPLEVRK